jgi:hypothetical protein
LLLSGFVAALVIMATIWRLYMVNIFYTTNENLKYANSTSAAVLEYLGAERRYSRLYTIWQDTNGQDYHQFTYNILPVKSNIRCWSIGRNYGHHDSWTCPKDLAVWSKELASYDYVFLGKIDKQFIAQFSELFEGGRVDAGNLYQVVTTGGLTTLRGVSYLNK